MAFVFQTERRLSLDRKQETPGPGDYPILEQKNLEPKGGFISKSARFFVDKPTTKVDQKPEFAKPAFGLNAGFGSFFLPKTLDKESKENVRPSANFGSKVERFSAKNEINGPGPGAYIPLAKLTQKKSFNPPKLPSGMSKILLRTRSVPSIPSRTQGYGYSDTVGI